MAEAVGNATVLDVGHGNATVIRDRSGHTLVIDAAPGGALRDELQRTNTTRVDNLVLSHADRDHIGGAAALLSGPVDTRALWVNTDGVKDSDTWRDLGQIALERHRRHGMQIKLQLDTTIGDALAMAGITVRVLHPSTEHTWTGARNADHRYGELSPNEMSAVVRVEVDATGQLLLPGDVDEAGLASLIAAGADLKSRVLVYPHHGGHCGGDDSRFARTLLTAVQPDVVIFSHGRNKFGNPLPQVVAEVRRARPAAQIRCTQLSKHCSVREVRTTSHLAPLPSSGAGSFLTCAGTMSIELGGEMAVLPAPTDHDQFVRDHVSTPLCL